ncbi:unnamed protein product [Jaminaea pallidilutea]
MRQCVHLRERFAVLAYAPEFGERITTRDHPFKAQDCVVIIEVQHAAGRSNGSNSPELRSSAATLHRLCARTFRNLAGHEAARCRAPEQPTALGMASKKVPSQLG